MKTLKLNKMTSTLSILFISIVAVFMLQFSNVEKSYADEDLATEQQEIATQDDNFNFWSWLFGIDENGLIHNQDEQVAYSDDEQNSNLKNEGNPIEVFKVNEEEKATNARDVWAVKDRNKVNTCQIWRIGDDGWNHSFIFEYTHWGYFGNGNDFWADCRHDDVRFYYNKNTEELAILSNDSSPMEWKEGTISYRSEFTASIINDKLKFNGGNNIENDNGIAQKTKTVYIDPWIPFIGALCLKNLYCCECVDICNHCYKHCNLGSQDETSGVGSIITDCFWKLGMNADSKCFDRYGCSVAFLRQFSNKNRKYLLEEDTQKDWCKYGNIFYNDTQLWSHRNYKLDDSIKSVKDESRQDVRNDFYVSSEKNATHTIYGEPRVKPIVEVNGVKKPVIVKDWAKGIYEFSVDAGDTRNYSRLDINIRRYDASEDIDVNGYIFFNLNCAEYADKDTKIDFIEESGNVTSVIPRIDYYGTHPTGSFNIKLREGVNGRFHVYNEYLDGDLYYTSTKGSSPNVEVSRTYKISGEVHFITSKGIDQRPVLNATVQFTELNDVVHETSVDKSTGRFCLALHKDVEGKFHIYSNLFDAYLDYKVIGDDSNIVINAVPRDCKIGGSVPYATKCGHVMDAKVVFTEENGTKHETVCDEREGYFRFDLPWGTKGKFYAYNDSYEGYLDYTVTDDNEYGVDIEVNEKKYPVNISIKTDNDDNIQIADINNNIIDISKPVCQTQGTDFKFKIVTPEKYDPDFHNITVLDNNNVKDEDNVKDEVKGLYTINNVKEPHEIKIKCVTLCQFLCTASNDDLFLNTTIDFIDTDNNDTIIASGYTGEVGFALIMGIQKGKNVKVRFHNDKKEAISKQFTAEKLVDFVIAQDNNTSNSNNKNKNMSLNGSTENHIDLYNQNGKIGTYNINDKGFANVDLLNTNFTYAKLYVGGAIVNLTHDASGKLVLKPNSK